MDRGRENLLAALHASLEIGGTFCRRWVLSDKILSCMQRKLFKVVTRAGKMRGAREEELRVGLS